VSDAVAEFRLQLQDEQDNPNQKQEVQHTA
jgi:hypothetical protein